MSFLKQTGRLFFFIMVAAVSCTKIDKQNSQEEIDMASFFTAHRSANPVENRLVMLLKEVNERNHFVRETVRRVGVPIWDKGSYSIQNMQDAFVAGATADTLFIIPFVRSTQKYVNAVMSVKVEGGIVSTAWFCDWQYQTRANTTDSVKPNTAEEFSLLFMMMNEATFGYTDFKLNDEYLFRNLARKNRQPGADSSAKGTIKLTRVSSGNQMRAQAPQYNCTLIYWSLVTYYNLNWHGVYSNMPTGEGGGGGSGPVVTSPPQCSTYINYRTTNPEPCLTPGWTPVGMATQQTSPCDSAKAIAKKMDSLFIKSKADSMVNAITNLATEPLEKGFAVYKEFRVSSGPPPKDTFFTGKYRRGNLITGDSTGVTISFEPPYLHQAAAGVHTHPPIGYSAHSPADVYSLIEAISDPVTKGYEGSFVVAANGSKYVLNVVNPAQAAAFWQTKAVFLDGKIWKVNSDIGRAFLKAQKYFEEKYKTEQNKINIAYELAMAVVLKQYNTGIVLNKRDSAGSFRPIMVAATTDPTKPKRIIYTMECM